MRSLVAITIALLVLVGASQAETAADLVTQFRVRAGEQDTLRSFADDTSILTMLDMAQDKVVRLGGYLPKRQIFTYTAGQASYVLDSTFRNATGVSVRKSGAWTPVPIKGQANPDSTSLMWDVTWVDSDSAELHIFGIPEPFTQDIIFSFDSASYGLDSGFVYETAVLVRTSQKWEPVMHNDGFKEDVASFTYMIRPTSVNRSRLYLRGDDFYDGDTIRVFGNLPPRALTLTQGDTILVSYNGKAPALDQLTDSCYVSSELQGMIVEEALVYWEQSKAFYQNMQALWQQLRIDMGVISPSR